MSFVTLVGWKTGVVAERGWEICFYCCRHPHPQPPSFAPLSGLSLFKHSAYILFLLRENSANWQPTRQCVNPKSREKAGGKMRRNSIKKQAKKKSQMKNWELWSSEFWTRVLVLFLIPVVATRELTTSFQLALTPEISLGLNMQTSKWNGMEIGQASWVKKEIVWKKLKAKEVYINLQSQKVEGTLKKVLS